MTMRRIANYFRVFCALMCLATCALAAASGYRGLVTFGGLPLPGAMVTATQGDQKLTAITDKDGIFDFPDLPSGTWTIEIDMQGFAPLKDQISIGPNTPVPPPWEMKMLPMDEIKAVVAAPTPAPGVATQPAAAAAAPEKKPDAKQPAKPIQPAANSATTTTPAPAEDERAANGLLINGSVNNGAASPFAQLPAFGNSRGGRGGLYNGSIAFQFNTSAWDANAYSLSGNVTPKPSFMQNTVQGNFGGPLRIPHIWKNGPNFFLGYTWSGIGNDSTQSAIVPTVAERTGDLFAFEIGGKPVTIINPSTGLPFLNNQVPVSTQAAALLNLYPLPNITGGADNYNYQIPIVSDRHVNSLNSRLGKQIKRKDNLSGTFAFQSVQFTNPNLFGFTDTTSYLGLNVQPTWIHRFSQHLVQTVSFQYSRSATLTTPYWENRENVSGDAGINGNDQDPTNWGPPTLAFSTSGIASLTDGLAAHNRNQTSAASYSMLWVHHVHNITFGGDFRRLEFNYLSQQDPRGIFTFTGQATGADLADFLIGVPDVSNIAFGNADKYFRQSVYDANVTDDWHVKPQLTVNIGLRWEYGAPVTELFNRLVNLDVTPTFSAEAPVLASNPVGPLTGQMYPTSLLRPDKHAIEPRVALSWRPISGSSLVIRSGYGIAYNTSVYQSIALQMAQQAPLSTSLSVANSTACPLTLANGFATCPSTTADNFAIDPNFRVGYVQVWNLIAQRDLPGSLVLTVTYTGTKGTRGEQEFVPNTYPSGATNPCPTCPTGFVFITSNGNLERESGDVQLRRRLHNGLTATAEYTFAKSIDDYASIGGAGPVSAASNTNPSIGSSGLSTISCPNCAQDWLNLKGERALSSFDQRHLLALNLQYTTGMGLGGKTLMSGWRGALLKEWSISTPITIGSGLPLTPIFLEPVTGTGITGPIRPDYDGAPIYLNSTPGVYLNSAAYSQPVSGQWGTAGRDSITGPMQFSFNAQMSRTFRLHDRYSLDVAVTSTNILNHITFTSWITTVNSSLFGTPAATNAPRNITTALRLRF